MQKQEIIFEDEDVIIVNKPAQMLTIPDRHDPKIPSILGNLRQTHDNVFVVHRIDRETSGILVFAKNEAAHRHLSMQFEHRETQKIYLALVEGIMPDDTGRIDKPIAEHATIPGRMTVARKGKESITDFEVVERFKNFTLVHADIKTGRTHQIRVHFQSQGFPLAIDAIYGKRDVIFAHDIKTNRFNAPTENEERPLMARTSLHAAKLTFTHPSKNISMTFEAPLPKDFKAVLQQLNKWGR